MSSDGNATCVVEDSEDEDGSFDSYETEKSPFRLGKILDLSNQRPTPRKIRLVKQIIYYLNQNHWNIQLQKGRE